MISVSKIFLALCLFCCSARTALVRAADDKILELAKQEARVSFYTTMGADEAKMLADAFQIKYPSMRVEITRLGPRRARASSQRRQAFHRLCAVQGQTFIKNLGRVISRSDIQQDDIVRTKMVSEDVTIADRLNQVMDDYKKYMR
jgi:hypothetical protein